MSITITAVSGWAIPELWFEDEIKKAFPDARIRVLYPKNPANPLEAVGLLNDFPSEWYLGYSLGSLWLQVYRKHLPESANRALLAPILSFTQEKLKAGKIPEAQLDYFIKTVKRAEDLKTVLKDFLALGNLFLPETAIQAMPDRKTLLKGLDFLKSVSTEPDPAKDCISLLGENDPFTDPEQAKSLLPHLEVLEKCGHEPGPLLARLAEIMSEREAR